MIPSLLLTTALLAPRPVVQTADQPSPLQRKLTVLTQDPILNSALLGIRVENQDGTLLFAKNSDLHLMPASNEKILSVYFALVTLGEDFRPKTEFWKEGKNIVVHAQGDPLLSPEQLRDVRKQLNVQPGAKILVKQDFNPLIGYGWEYDDLKDAYACKISAFTVDAGRFVVQSKDGFPVVPGYSGVTVVNRGGSGTPKLNFDRENARLTITGKLPKSSDNVERFALPSPNRAAANILGGSFENTDVLPDRAPDAVIEGKPVKELAQLCLEPSDNMIAEHLLLLAGNRVAPFKADSWGESCKAMVDFYTNTVKVPEGLIRPVDGSGLSRHDYVTTGAIVQILRYIYASPSRDTFMTALPKPGEGTLAHRLDGYDLVAKTGTLSGASSLSGILQTSDGPVFFSIMMNNYTAPASQIRALQDKIVQILAGK